MGSFTASAIQCAFVNIAEDLEVEVQQASYLTSLVIAILGGAPLFWRPLSNTYGRRPIFLLSLICSMVGNIGCAKSPSYATMGLCRAITAFFISPAAAIGSAVVSEMFFKKQRATVMGAWTIMVTLGIPIAPFIFGFLALRVDYRWIYWVLAIVGQIPDLKRSAGVGKAMSRLLTPYRQMRCSFFFTSAWAPRLCIGGTLRRRPVIRNRRPSPSGSAALTPTLCHGVTLSTHLYTS